MPGTIPTHDRPENHTTALLMRVRAADPDALAKLLGRYQQHMVTWARQQHSQLVRGQFETMDIVQDVAVSLIEYLPNVELEDSRSFRRLLYRMIKNSVLGKVSYLTAARRHIARNQPLSNSTVISLDPPDPQAKTPCQLLGEEEERAWVRLALPLLDPDDQELILRRELDSTTFPELGSVLHLTADAVRMRFGRAMARLVKIIDDLQSGRLDVVANDPPGRTTDS